MKRPKYFIGIDINKLANFLGFPENVREKIRAREAKFKYNRDKSPKKN